MWLLQLVKLKADSIGQNYGLNKEFEETGNIRNMFYLERHCNVYTAENIASLVRIQRIISIYRFHGGLCNRISFEFRFTHSFILVQHM